MVDLTLCLASIHFNFLKMAILLVKTANVPKRSLVNVLPCVILLPFSPANKVIFVLDGHCRY